MFTPIRNSSIFFSHAKNGSLIVWKTVTSIAFSFDLFTLWMWILKRIHQLASKLHKNIKSEHTYLIPNFQFSYDFTSTKEGNVFSSYICEFKDLIIWFRSTWFVNVQKSAKKEAKKIFEKRWAKNEIQINNKIGIVCFTFLYVIEKKRKTKC